MSELPVQSYAQIERLVLARNLLAAKLSPIFKTWTVNEELVLGPGTLAVRVEDQHQLGPQHVDIAFVLNREDESVPLIWDCAAGVGSSAEEILRIAIDIWVRSTFAVIQEFLKRDGSEATHFADGAPGGCPGWHVIHGPILSYGRGDAPMTLQTWALESALLAHVGPIATKAFDRPMLNGVKLMFGFGGEKVSEVRINGAYNKAASEHLKTLDWPQSHDPAFARCFLLFVHPTSSQADSGNSDKESTA